MLQIFGKNNRINKKSTLGTKVDDFYTKQHKKNLKFFECFETFSDEIMRIWSLAISEQKDGEEVSDIITEVVKKHALKYGLGYTEYGRILMDGSLNFKEEHISLIPFLLQEGEDVQKMEDDMMFEGKQIPISFDVSHFDGIQKFIKYVEYKEKYEFLHKNGFQYNPKYKGYTNVIYLGNLFDAFSIIEKKSGLINKKVLSEIRSLFPDGVKNTTVNTEKKVDRQTFYHSVLEIELKNGERVDLINEGGSAFFLVKEYTKEMYIFFRELYVIYMNQYKENFNKKVISLLDLSTEKNKNNIACHGHFNYDIIGASYTKKEKASKKAFGKDFLEAFGQIKENKDYIKKEILERTKIELMFPSRWWGNYSDKIDNFGMWGSESLPCGDIPSNRNWFHYDLDFQANGPIFIDSLIENIKKSPHNTNMYTTRQKETQMLESIFSRTNMSQENLKSPKKREVGNDKDFQISCLEFMGVDIFQILREDKVGKIKEEVRRVFKGVAHNLVGFLIEEQIKKRSEQEVLDSLLDLCELSIEEGKYSEGLKYLENNERLVGICGTLKSDKRLLRIFKKSQGNKAPIKLYKFLLGIVNYEVPLELSVEEKESISEKEKKEVQLEKENFKVDSGGWEKIELGGIKVKISHGKDIIEFLEGDMKGEQLFTWEAAMRETRKAGKRLPTKEEFQNITRKYNIEKQINIFPGHRYSDGGGFRGVGKHVEYWTSSQGNSKDAFNAFIRKGDGEVSYHDSRNWGGNSVRCVQKNRT